MSDERGICEAEWSFDVDFDVMCTRPAGHGSIQHRAEVEGNGGVKAVVEWDTGQA